MIALAKLVVQIVTLTLAANSAWPKLLPIPKALAHTTAAILASDSRISPELLLATARTESRFDPTATSRLDGRTGRRKTGLWPSDRRGSSFVAPYFCGPIQARAWTWARCLELRSIHVGYQAGADELRQWFTRYCHGDLRCVLAGHGGGFRAVARVKAEARGEKLTKKPAYWKRVLWRHDRLASPRRIR